MKGISVFIVAVAIAAVITIYGFMRNEPTIDFHKATLVIGESEFSVEVADSTIELIEGLQFRESLPENAGMVFIFGETKSTTFWMKNTLIPLDMVWVTDNTVVGFEENVSTQIGQPDNELIRYPSPGAVDIGIEFNAGTVANYGIEVGDRIELK